jgi:hypothetical protein
MKAQREGTQKDRRQATLKRDGEDLFLVLDGVRIAKRGRPGTAHAETWISIEPGWVVLDRQDGGLDVRHDDVSIQ